MSTGRAIPGDRTLAHTEDRIVRYSAAERINHWIAGLSYVYLLMTGLAFWSPYLFWMAVVWGGGPTARFWHPWVGLVFFVSVWVMFSWWRDDMTATEADRKWAQDVRFYIGNEDEKLPAIGKYNWGQKQFFWLMFWGAILLLLSGLVLWFTDSLPWSLRFLRYLAVLVHAGVALLTVGGFIIHVYMGTAMVRGSFTSITRGTVSHAWARHHHRLWYEKSVGGSSSKK